MSRAAVEIPERAVAEFCRRHRIRKLALFGSVLRPDFRPDSDIDVLVEFERGQTPGLITMAALEIELSGVLGRKVDLRTAGDLSRYFRDDVIRTAEVKYSAGWEPVTAQSMATPSAIQNARSAIRRMP